MIPALAILLFLQLVGEIASRGLGLPLPGPVVGLLLLLGSCALRPALAEMLRPVVTGILGNLSLFFVPAGVGVIAHLGQFRDDGLAIALALTVSTALAIAAGALVFTAVVRWMGGDEE
ncbi:CidA/LrgA family protein [Paracoccus aminovorans]|uniref:CidA/LrgA family protein n=1 Tax=Paracoccus aminovorans TaxID=34004 RepID=UPI002B2577BE|nr:CidA/LrgA family protein [Paracoccus aminovorans]